MKFFAKWIWKKQGEYKTYNDAIVARKSFTLSAFVQATAYVTADSFYRLKINGEWVNDGPSRAWPEHFKYDVIDVASYLREGQNEIEITARYYGCGDFHRLCQQAGLLAQFEVKLADRNTELIVTDSSWVVASLSSLMRNVPKISIQRSPYEIYDARLEGAEEFTSAVELYEATDGPWQGLTKRDVKLLTKDPVDFARFLGAAVVQYEGEVYCFPAARLLFPHTVEAQSYTATPCGFASVVTVSKTCLFEIEAKTLKVSVDGQTQPAGKYTLDPGTHLLLALVSRLPDESGPELHEKERVVKLICSEKYALHNPMNPSHENPWVFINLGHFAFIQDDLDWDATLERHPDLVEKGKAYAKFVTRVFAEVINLPSFKQVLGELAECKPSEEMLMTDHAWKFSARQVVEDGAPLVEYPDALMADNSEWTTIHPSAKGDVEVAYDFGEQRVGYLQFELFSAAGVNVQFNGVEHIASDGGIQHTDLVGVSRNGMNYITKEGLNTFTSYYRRGGRFIYITLRDQTEPVKIRRVRLFESTYPVNPLGSFSCSDSRLNQIWTISTRTLTLCMEDTFTDCPLYEQTFWVGDARNESIFAYPVFGAEDLAKSCIDIAGHSLERFPMVGSQVPSAWFCIIPVWSFLWGISIWDYYWQTGDKEFLKQRFALVIQNLKGAEKQLQESGLFSAAMWNLFDWTGIDQEQRTVLHNSFFMVGAIDAALKCAEVINDRQYDVWMNAMRSGLIEGLNLLWDDENKSYPDSIRNDGSISPKTCHHTSFLSVLYEVANSKNREQLRANTIQPLETMTQAGSPFAMLYLYEALENIGADQVIMQSIFDNYLPMLAAGSTTVWESFPGSPWSPDGTRFPTRSHCHAWSSAPTYFLNRIVLGIRQTAPGGTAFTISPQLSGLTWASGRTASHQGVVEVRWELKGQELRITINAPLGVECTFVKNDSMKGLSIFVNGEEVSSEPRI